MPPTPPAWCRVIQNSSTVLERQPSTHAVSMTKTFGCAAAEEASMNLEGLELMSEQECRWLLCQARVGRVAVSRGEVPAVFPVNYMVAGEEILFFTGEGTKLRAAAANTTASCIYNNPVKNDAASLVRP